MTPKTRRWGFRARLTALTAAVFVIGGMALLGVQYLLVDGLFTSAIDGITDCEEGAGPVGGDMGELPLGCEPVAYAQVNPVDIPVPAGNDVGDGERVSVELIVHQSNALSEEVLSGLVMWSIVTLLAFALVAVLAASWLSRRPFARIRQITGTTKRITRDDLDQRLDLPGPSDEIKELGDTIDGMLDGLEAAFTQQERFVTNASHELRTPLTISRTALEVPLAQGEVPAHLEPAVRRALDANARSETLIAALLQLARASSRSQADAVEAVDLAALVTRVVGQHQNAVAEAKLSVTVTSGAAQVTSSNQVLLELAVGNLVDNAVRHNIEGGSICVTTGSSEGAPWLEVSNTGPALTSDQVARLTEPFNRGDHTRTTAGAKGVGLGLSLVQNIAESAGATLNLSPGPSGGLTARLDFEGD